LIERTVTRDQDEIHVIGRTEKERKRLWLKEYDYSQPGAYFVTICTKDRVCRFGKIVDGEMRANGLAAVVQSCWNDLPNHFPNVQLDEFVIMPNHVHGVIILLDDMVGADSGLHNIGCSTVGSRHASTLHGPRNALGNVVGSFKSALTKRINEMNGTGGAPFWQRGYYDHIIRDDRSLVRIREYIAHNPQRWGIDKENSEYEGNGELEGRMASTGTNHFQDATR
jgi:putative transposase